MGYYPTYIDELVEIANSRYPYAVDSGFVQSAQVEQLLLRSGYEATSEQGVLIYNQAVQTGAESISGNLAIQTELVEDTATHELSVVADNFSEVPPTSTTPKIKKGALSFEVSPFLMCMGALYGANLGWESYNEYPEFWTDLSNDVFFNNEKDLLPGIQASELVKGGTLLLRVLEDGGVRGYCEKQRLEKILQTAYDKGAFNGNGIFKPTYTESGTFVLNGGGASVDYIRSVNNMKDAEYNITRDNIRQLENYYHKTANAMSIQRQDDIANNIRYTRAYLYTLTNSPRTVTIGQTNTVANVKQDCFGYVEVWTRLSDNTGSGTFINYGAGDDNRANLINGVSGAINIFSTVGATFEEPLENIKYNPNYPTVTDRNNVFANYPTWLENGFSVPKYNEETKENEQIDYLPFPIFDILNELSKEPNANAQKGDLPQNPTDPLKLPQFLIDLLAPSIPFDNGLPSENPNGNTPTLIPPSNNNSSKLFTVYNPSGANLDALGGFLWSDSIATLIKELFSNNRMDAIISLHQVYVTPSTTTAHNIILGNLDSGVSSPVVNNQYVELDCGQKYIAEIYGDARDYLNVDAQVYLPFIGFRNVDPHDIINCYLRIKYTIDVYTGSCLAQLIVTKGNVTQTLYTFEGNCSVQIPLTGSDRARIIGAIASTVATGIATGGVGAVGMAVGQVASGGAQSSIQRTSGFSGNCGAMAIKKPYIVMTRLKSADAVDYNKLVGNPTNKTVYLRNCNGFTRVKEIHLDNLKCTDQEKALIYQALKQGIVL